MLDYPKPPFPKQKQSMPGKTNSMKPVPDHGEESYKGSGRCWWPEPDLRPKG